MTGEGEAAPGGVHGAIVPAEGMEEGCVWRWAATEEEGDEKDEGKNAIHKSLILEGLRREGEKTGHAMEVGEGNG